ncbi:MAG: nitroreductase family protein [Sedimentisphaerales bacterium]|nr:nitroreductase family protein [Sedimentisphaerales bacterium]
MTVFEAIQKRYSCRAYQEKQIEQEKLDKLTEAARLAPSAKNTQDWRFVVVTDSQIKEKVAANTNRPQVFEKAGAIIVGCSNSDYVMQCGQAIAPIDVSIALEHICLQATELGLATCWIGSFNTENIREILGIPGGINIVELMAVGYPADSAKQPNRLSTDEIICYNKWQF